MKDVEELAVRSSASFGFKHLLERAVLDGENSAGFGGLIIKIVFPALETGVLQGIEVARAEVLTALDHPVKLNPTILQCRTCACFSLER
jgi:hypothetical protein